MERDYIRLNYWTSDRSLVVDYVFWDLGERGWRIYIISHIDYQGRDCSSHAAHWLQDNDSSYPYICWNGNIATLEQAKSVASLWAECTTEYIRSYKSFDNIASQLKDKAI